MLTPALSVGLGGTSALAGYRGNQGGGVAVQETWVTRVAAFGDQGPTPGWLGCARALALLRTRRTADGGFPMEVRRARTVQGVVPGGTHGDGGPGGRTRRNPWVTVSALDVLQRAPGEGS